MADCKVKGENQRKKTEHETNTENGEGQVNSTPPEKALMKELEASEETQLSVINEVLVVDVENNEVIDKNGTRHEGNILSDVEGVIIINPLLTTLDINLIIFVLLPSFLDSILC